MMTDNVMVAAMIYDDDEVLKVTRRCRIRLALREDKAAQLHQITNLPRVERSNVEKL